MGEMGSQHTRPLRYRGSGRHRERGILCSVNSKHKTIGWKEMCTEPLVTGKPLL